MNFFVVDVVVNVGLGNNNNSKASKALKGNISCYLNVFYITF